MSQISISESAGWEDSVHLHEPQREFCSADREQDLVPIALVKSGDASRFAFRGLVYAQRLVSGDASIEAPRFSLLDLYTRSVWS